MEVRLDPLRYWGILRALLEVTWSQYSHTPSSRIEWRWTVDTVYANYESSITNPSMTDGA